jgi:hypothetical protein
MLLCASAHCSNSHTPRLSKSGRALPCTVASACSTRCPHTPVVNPPASTNHLAPALSGLGRYYSGRSYLLNPAKVAVLLPASALTVSSAGAGRCNQAPVGSAVASARHHLAAPVAPSISPSMLLLRLLSHLPPPGSTSALFSSSCSSSTPSSPSHFSPSFAAILASSSSSRAPLPFPRPFARNPSLPPTDKLLINPDIPTLFRRPSLIRRRH